jgi:hypothetical protein
MDISHQKEIYPQDYLSNKLKANKQKQRLFLSGIFIPCKELPIKVII